MRSMVVLNRINGLDDQSIAIGAGRKKVFDFKGILRRLELSALRN